MHLEEHPVADIWWHWGLLCYFQVLFGTADGQVIVMDCHGRMLAHVLLHESDGILNMSWNYPSFLVEDSSESDTDSDDYSPPQGRVVCTSSCLSLAHAHEDISNARVLSCPTEPARFCFKLFQAQVCVSAQFQALVEQRAGMGEWVCSQLCHQPCCSSYLICAALPPFAQMR